MSHSVSRRKFLQTVAATAAAAPFLHVRTGTAAPMLRHASIGASGQALSDLMSFAKHPSFDLVAVADVDLARFERLQQRFPKVRVYQDWRELLKKEHANIDSVNVSTPDHMHCLIALEAMKRGKPVYVQKPLCNTIQRNAHAHRVRAREGAHDADGDSGVVDAASSVTARRSSGAASSARFAKCTRSRTRAGETTSRCPRATDPVPAPLDWDEWLGVSAPRPFKKAVYHPGEWRRRVGFGTGTLGDMGCHIYSPPYRALELTSPLVRDGVRTGADAPRAGRRRRA